MSVVKFGMQLSDLNGIYQVLMKQIWHLLASEEMP
jgi:hypothetical protein